MTIKESLKLISSLRQKYKEFAGTTHVDMILLLCSEHEKLLNKLVDKTSDKYCGTSDVTTKNK